MNRFEEDYKDLVRDVYMKGTVSSNRTGIHTICCFNKSLTIDLQKGFPIVTGRKIFFDKAYHEYIWIKEGLTTLTYLHQNNILWWDEYADKNGDLGKTYGYQLRSFNGEVDQLQYINSKLKFERDSRRMHVTFWNPSDLADNKLPPCYTGMTFMVEGNKLNMSFQLRSSDLLLGLPYDICVMALFVHNIADFNELKVGKLGVQITNAHIYQNHIYQTQEYLLSETYNLPKLLKDNTLSKYKHGKHIKIQLNK